MVLLTALIHLESLSKYYPVTTPTAMISVWSK